MNNAITACSRPLPENSLVKIDLYIEGKSSRANLMVRRRSARGYSATRHPKGFEVVWTGGSWNGWGRQYTRTCKTEAEAREFAEAKFEGILRWIAERDEKAAA